MTCQACEDAAKICTGIARKYEQGSGVCMPNSVVAATKCAEAIRRECRHPHPSAEAERTLKVISACAGVRGLRPETASSIRPLWLFF